MDHLQLVTRDYDPTDADLRPCARCGDMCMPFPARDSPTCSACWFDREREAEAPAKEAGRSPNPTHARLPRGIANRLK